MTYVLTLHIKTCIILQIDGVTIETWSCVNLQHFIFKLNRIKHMYFIIPKKFWFDMPKLWNLFIFEWAFILYYANVPGSNALSKNQYYEIPDYQFSISVEASGSRQRTYEQHLSPKYDAAVGRKTRGAKAASRQPVLSWSSLSNWSGNVNSMRMSPARSSRTS